MQYKGGKNGSGVYQRIISLMPKHPDHYAEFFLGSGAILRRKLPAQTQAAYEIDPKTFAAVSESIDATEYYSGPFNDRSKDPGRVYFTRPGDLLAKPILNLINGDAFEALRSIYLASSIFWTWNDPARTLIYLDPPYLNETRSSPGKIYQHELMETGNLEDEPGHAQLLKLILAVPCRVMISHYRCRLYEKALFGWRRVDIPTTNRAGTRVIESVYCNFPAPFELHDYRFLGTDFHDRDRIKKKKNRWITNLENMEANERYAVIGALMAKRDELASVERLTDEHNAKMAKARAAEAEKELTPANNARSGVTAAVKLFEK